jgi:hypothetical protein
MVDGSPRLFARAGGQWYGVALQESVTEKFTLGTTKNYLRLDEAGFVVVKDHNETANFGSTTTIGDTDSEHVEITSTHLKIKDGTDNKVTITGGDIKMSGQLQIDSLDYAGSGLADFGNISIGLTNSALGKLNISIGWEAGKALEGTGAYDHATVAGLNTLIGSQAGLVLDTGFGNVCLGHASGDTITSGDYNICIGYASDAVGAIDDRIAIGRSATVSGANGIAIGQGLTAAADVFIVGKTGAGNHVQINCSDDKSTYFCASAGTTGGSGSAGSGNEYIEMDVNGTTYKVLHDGTV